MGKQIAFLILVFFLIQFNVLETKPAYQMIENRPGYIGVFIRYGDTPLSEINPLLAEAFRERHEIATKVPGITKLHNLN